MAMTAYELGGYVGREIHVTRRGSKEPLELQHDADGFFFDLSGHATHGAPGSKEQSRYNLTPADIATIYRTTAGKIRSGIVVPADPVAGM